MRRTMSLLWQWEQMGSNSLLMDLKKNDETWAQAPHRYS